MTFAYQSYRVTIGFKNDSGLYGEETFTCMGRDQDQAEAKALQSATGSELNADRYGERRMVVLETEEVSAKAA
ncbi:hypothetical protein [Erythrobacter aureus]|uniref:Uncharacterized protein n=1 Tax=Erythrobacter aureus TaxID=2182384 RepID=A0A345YJ57_9SPHN|nr:hypothetical protein [Erythrobacter aureus]AXK43959.1 hypothetical protein DVR09_16015 [Erythrobacter aureus]